MLKYGCCLLNELEPLKRNHVISSAARVELSYCRAGGFLYAVPAPRICLMVTMAATIKGQQERSIQTEFLPGWGRVPVLFCYLLDHVEAARTVDDI